MYLDARKRQSNLINQYIFQYEISGSSIGEWVSEFIFFDSVQVDVVSVETSGEEST